MSDWSRLEHRHCNLSDAVFHDVDLRGAEFRDVNLEDGRFLDVSLRCGQFKNITLAGARIHNGDLTGLRITDCRLADVWVDGVPLDQALAAWGDRSPDPRLAPALAWLSERGIALPGGRTVVDGYGDSPELSEALLELIRAGRKRAGTGLLAAMQADGDPIPLPGDVEIVLDHAGVPALLTRTTRVELLPFGRVGAAYAAVEGEGDGSLEYWRRGHWAFFGRECARIGITPTEEMIVVCCEFELLRDLAGL